MKKRWLNLGCGFKKKESNDEEEWINIDVAPEVKPDKVVDVEKRLPFPKNYFDGIFTQHTLEHIRPCYFRDVLNEMARVTKNNGIWDIELPFFSIPTISNYDHYMAGGFRTFNTLLVGDKREYYTRWWRLIDLKKQPSRLYKLFYYLFPFLKKNIYYKFQLVKK